MRESGLAAALEWLGTNTRKHYDVEVGVVTDPSADPQSADVRTFLYRSVRELLLNAVKHGGKNVHITMKHAPPDKVKIVVADDGPGFDPAILVERESARTHSDSSIFASGWAVLAANSRSRVRAAAAHA